MSTMPEDQTYNGWKNYPTWNVNLWLSNEEPLYRAALIAARTVEGDETISRRLALADHYKAWVRDELAPDLGSSFAADLLGYALDEVDWLEIADSWLEDIEE